MDRIYDPADPNLHGYRRCRYNPTLREFISGKLRCWWGETLWSIYGRGRIVAWYLHREQTCWGKVENRIAASVLRYIYGP